MTLVLTADSDGWWSVEADTFSTQVRLRFQQAPSGRAQVTDVCVSRRDRITAAALRGIPIGRIEALANAPGLSQRALEPKRGDRLLWTDDRASGSKETVDALRLPEP